MKKYIESIVRAALEPFYNRIEAQVLAGQENLARLIYELHKGEGLSMPMMAFMRCMNIYVDYDESMMAKAVNERSGSDKSDGGGTDDPVVIPKRKHKKHQFPKICPECNKQCLGWKGLGTHRARAHGVKSAFKAQQKPATAPFGVSELNTTSHEQNTIEETV